MGKNFRGEPRKQSGKTKIPFAIGAARQFEHALTAAPQPVGISPANFA